MTYTDGVPSDNAGYPYGYFGDPAENRAWDNFWANHPAPDGIGIQDHVARAWAHLARRFAGTAGLLGYDLMNEPWPGSQWPSCANPAGCPPTVGFDSTDLSPFYKRVFSAIRAVDPDQLRDVRAQSVVRLRVQHAAGSPGDPHAIFGFHDYCLPGGAPGGGREQRLRNRG